MRLLLTSDPVYILISLNHAQFRRNCLDLCLNGNSHKIVLISFVSRIFNSFSIKAANIELFCEKFSIMKVPVKCCFLTQITVSSLNLHLFPSNHKHIYPYQYAQSRIS